MEWNERKWSGMKWNRMEWTEMQWNEKKCNGMCEWIWMEWNGIEWDEEECNGMEYVISSTFVHIHCTILTKVDELFVAIIIPSLHTFPCRTMAGSLNLNISAQQPVGYRDLIKLEVPCGPKIEVELNAAMLSKSGRGKFFFSRSFPVWSRTSSSNNWSLTNCFVVVSVSCIAENSFSGY